jgi:hypothetical protein
MAKLSAADWNLVEVGILGMDVVISYGSCRPE